MTDIVGSTVLWREDPDSMDPVLRRHDELIQEVAAEFFGNAPKSRGEGDSAFIVFPTVAFAYQAASAINMRMSGLGEVSGRPLEVRAAIHVGETRERDAEFHGNAVNRCARIRGVSHGGQVLLSEAAALQARETLSSPFELLELGPVRLKDLLEPERLFQLAHPNLKSEFPALRSLDKTPHNLPPQVSSFIGRKTDLEEVQRLLNLRRQVTLVGAGGSGKTRLAIQVAAEGIDQFPEGVWFIDLAPLQVGAETQSEFLRVLRQKPSSGAPELIDVLAGMRCLLVVDNCERVLDSARKICREILRGAPGVELLITSRQPLGYDGEQVYRVPTLGLPPADSESLDVIAESEAVALLIERARLKTPRYAIDEQNAKWLKRIVHRLDGLPLPIEMAASRLHVMSAEESYERLADLFKGLGKGPADAVERHKTIEATISWSFGMLTEDERSLFLCLALLPGGWTLPMAEEIAESLGIEEDPLALITGIVDKSMAVAASRSEGSRTRMLVPIREFGLKKGSNDARARAAVLRWAIGASARLNQSGDTGVAMGAEELGNFHSALELAIVQKEVPAAVGLIRCLFRTWMATGRLAEGRSFAERVLGMTNPSEGHDWGFINNYRGMIAWAQKDLAVAEDSLRAAVEYWEKAGDLHGSASGHCNLGLVLASQERWTAAEEALIAAHRLFVQMSDETNAARTAANLANMMKEQGKFGEAIPYLDFCLQVALKTDDRLAEHTANGILAKIALAEGDLPTASAHVRQALSLTLALSDALGTAQGLVTAAELSLKDDRPDVAAQMIAAAKAVFEGATFSPTAQALAELNRVEDDISRQLQPQDLRRNQRLGRLKGAVPLAEAFVG
jgi:predicted ATPase/class 3 adenylate cyclase